MSHNLSGKQEAALDALMSEPTIEAAARKAGVTPRTVYRWIATPLFCGEYRAARQKAVQHATARLQSAASDAVTTLQSVMTDAEAPVPARVNAAKAVLEFAIKVTELEDLTARIEALEQSTARPT